MRNIFLVASREYLSYAKAWGFWLGLLLAPAIMILSTQIPRLAEKSQAVRYFTVIDEDGVFTQKLSELIMRDHIRDINEILTTRLEATSPEFDISGLNTLTPEQQFILIGKMLDTHKIDLEGIEPSDPKFIFIPPPEDTHSDIASYISGQKQVADSRGVMRNLYAVIIFRSNQMEIDYWSDDIVTQDLRSYVRRAAKETQRFQALLTAGLSEDFISQIDANIPTITMRRPGAAGEDDKVTILDRTPHIAAIVLSIGLWLIIFSVVNFLTTSTIQERSKKIFDTLLTSIKLSDLLIGKLLGILALSFTIPAVWGIAGLVVSAEIIRQYSDIALPFIAAILSPELFIPALISLILGYLLFGVIFLAVGALCQTLHEAQALLSPIMLVMMLPMLLMIIAIRDPSSPILAILAWIPLFTPFLIILRIPTGLPFSELMALIGLMFVTTICVLWLCTRIYRAGVVDGMNIKQAGDWVRQKIGLT